MTRDLRDCSLIAISHCRCTALFPRKCCLSEERFAEPRRPRRFLWRTRGRPRGRRHRPESPGGRVDPTVRIDIYVAAASGVTGYPLLVRPWGMPNGICTCVSSLLENAIRLPVFPDSDSGPSSSNPSRDPVTSQLSCCPPVRELNKTETAHFSYNRNSGNICAK